MKENMTPYMKRMPIFAGGKDLGIKGVGRYTIEEILELIS